MSARAGLGALHFIVLLGLFGAFGSGCETSPPPPVGPAVEVSLPVTWAAGAPLSGATAFTLEAATAAARLQIDGAWWKVELELDGEALPAVTPGYAPLDLPLPALEAGPHRLALRVSPPTTEPPPLSLPNKNRQPQPATLRLRLGGGPEIEPFSLPLVEGALVPSVAVRSAPEGATLELAVVRDGAVIRRWPEVPVGTALPPQPWAGERWDIGQPALYVATAILRDAAGVVLDQRSARLGFREVRLDDGALRLNAAPLTIMALHADPRAPLAPVLEALVLARGNGLELHGTVTPAAFFAAADELGLPVVYLARCDGRLWERGDNPRTAWDLLSPQLREQEGRLLAAATDRPALLAWICEGAEDLRVKSCGGLRADPLHRPVLGLDGAAAGISGWEQSAAPAAPRSWNVEIGVQRDRMPSPAAAARAFALRTGEGGPGGVFLAPGEGDRAAWAEAWSGVAAEMGVRPWAQGARRAMSSLTVTGLAPGQIVRLDLPWMASVGAAADGQGVARLEAWYEGPATLRLGERSAPVALEAGRWEGGRRTGGGPSVSAAALGAPPG